MTKISTADKEIAKTMASAFGGAARVFQYWDNDERSRIAILHAADQPSAGATSYSTIGLSHWSIPGSVKPPLGVEIVGACDSDVEDFGNVVSTAAFCVINSGWKCEPGRIFADVVSAHYADTTVPHLFFVSPFLWDADLSSRVIVDRTVAWLQAVPISSAERTYAEEKGGEALEEKFEEKQIDVFDLYRSSVVSQM